MRMRIRKRNWLWGIASLGYGLAPIGFSAQMSPGTIVPKPTQASSAPGPYLLVSSFQCHPSQPGCQTVDAVLRYRADAGPDFGEFDGVHISGIPGPQGLAIHPPRGTLLVVSRSTHSVREYNLHTGVALSTFVMSGVEGLHMPSNILFTSGGDLLVTSTQSSGNFDKFNGILKFDGDTGAFIGPFVDGGSVLVEDCADAPAAPCLRGPAAMVWGPNGNLFVASNFNDRVIEYDPTGTYLGHFASSKLVSPNGLAIRPNGTTNAGNVLATSLYHAMAGDADKIVEFNGVTRQLVAANGGVFINGLQAPGPLLWESSSVLLISDRLFWSLPTNYSDRIRRNVASNGLACTAATCEPDVPAGQSAAYFTWTNPTPAVFPLHYGTGMLIAQIGCLSDSECYDGNPCTDEACSAGVCSNVPNDAIDPDDGLYCNGVEDHCENGQIVYSVPPPDCSDAFPCTIDLCNESSEMCQNVLAADQCLIAGACYDAGAADPASDCRECDPLLNSSNWTNLVIGTPCGSQAMTICTDPDTCNESGTCLANNHPDGIACDDGLFCNGAESCGSGACQPGTPVVVLYGDVFPPGGNGVVDVDDILYVLDAFANPPSFPNGDIFPCGGNGVIDVDDILAELDAFSGTYACPHPCPP